MGQRCFCLMYGCKTDLDWYDEGAGGLLPCYTSKLPHEDRCLWPQWERDDDDELCLIGFWVAVGGSGQKGIPYLSSFPLTRPYERYGDAIDLVKERWRIFAAWCAEQGHVLGEPELFLMETETA